MLHVDFQHACGFDGSCQVNERIPDCQGISGDDGCDTVVICFDILVPFGSAVFTTDRDNGICTIGQSCTEVEGIAHLASVSGVEINIEQQLIRYQCAGGVVSAKSYIEGVGIVEKVPSDVGDVDGEILGSTCSRDTKRLLGVFALFLISIEIACCQGHPFLECVPRRRLDADHGILSETISIAATAGTNAGTGVRIKDGKQEIVVQITSPSPVDVEEIVAVIAVDDESMSSTRRLTAIDHGPIL